METKQSVFKTLKTYLGNLWYDFRISFKYNNMKLASWLVALPGIFLGFFLGFHANVCNNMSFTYTVQEGELLLQESYLKPFDFSGLVLFLMILFGILNIFTSLTMSSKKSRGSVILATITSAIVVISGALYLYAIFFYKGLYDAGTIKTNIEFYTQDLYISIVSIIVSIVVSILGVVLGYINFDRTYEKVDR